LAHWVGAQGRVKLLKKTQSTPTCDVPHTEPQTQNKKKNCFQTQLEDLYWIRRGFEQLSSSNVWRVMELKSLFKKALSVGFEGFKTVLESFLWYGSAGRGVLPYPKQIENWTLAANQPHHQKTISAVCKRHIKLTKNKHKCVMQHIMDKLLGGCCFKLLHKCLYRGRLFAQNVKYNVRRLQAPVYTSEA